MKIDFNKTYYYNNRPVKVIQKTSENMYLVCANTSGITSALEAQHFCEGCLIGDSDNKLPHTCEEAEHMIEDFLDKVNQEDEVFWVHKKTLKETYFEQKANDELLKQISNMKDEKRKLDENLKFLESKKSTLNHKIELSDKELGDYLDRIHRRSKDFDELEEKISEHAAKLKDVKIVSDIGVSIEISTSEYKELLINSAERGALRNGGVDNWDWFSESLGDTDYDEEANKTIREQFKKSLLINKGK